MIIFDRMGHLVSTTDAEELHSFARSIGLKKRWYQITRTFKRDGSGHHYEHHAHYDLTTYRMMNRARRQGATMVDPKELIRKAWWANERTTTKDR